MNEKLLTDETGEVHELRSADMRAMRSASEALPPELLVLLPACKPGSRGQQRRPTKVPVTVRYSPEVIAFFRATGKGWQRRKDTVLQQNIATDPH